MFVNSITIVCYSFPPPFIPEKYSEAWLYDAVADLFKEWLSEDAIKTLK